MKKNIILFIALVLASFFSACSDDEFTPPNYVTFEPDDVVNLSVGVGQEKSHEVMVYTNNISENARTFELLVDESTSLEAAGYTLPASLMVPGGTNVGTFTVEVSDMDLGLTGKKLVIALAKKENLYIGEDPYTIMVNRECEGTDFAIDFEFDGYASEIDWSLKDANGNVLVTGGGYQDGTASYSRVLCPDSGTYTFTVTDSYGDGLTYPNFGSITLSYAGEVLEEIPGDFGSGTSVEVIF